MGSAQGRTLLAGLVVAASAAVLVIVGGPLGIVDVWPVLLVAGAGLLVDVPRLRHALALASGIAGGSVTVWTGAAILPPVPVGRAIAVAIGVLLLTTVTVASAGRIRLSMQLVGWAAAVAAMTPGAAAGAAAGGTAGGVAGVTGVTLLGAIASDAATLLVAAGVGLLVAQVAQLVAIGRIRPDRAPGGGRGGPGGGPAALLLAAVVLGGVLAGPSAARADEHGVVEHRQTVMRTLRADGTLAEGRVVTRLTASGTGDVTVVLRDQAVGGLRSLTGLTGPGPLRERAAPEVAGSTVTHRLADGATARTVAALDRSLPVALEVAVELDGEPVTPAAVRGRSGRLTVTYTLTNLTAEPREVQFFDGGRRARTVTRELAVPLVGELVVAVDDRYRAVRSPDGTVTDGAVHAELVLAAPAGDPVRTVTWSADVDAAVLPPVTVRVTPLPLLGDAGGRVDDDLVRRTAALLRDSADVVAVARDRTSALGVLSGANGANGAPSGAPGDADLARGTVERLEALLADLVVAGAELDELRALAEAQDARLRAGDGAVHGLLAPEDVAVDGGGTARPHVDATVVYLIAAAGQSDAAPGTPLRLLLSAVLLLAVGLLGRATARLVA